MNTIREEKNKSIKLVMNLYNAMTELSNHWTESGSANSDFLTESGYPFEMSFDELTREVADWYYTMKGLIPPKNGKHEYINDDGGKFVGHYLNGKLHGAVIEYYPNTEQIDTYVEFYEGVESSPKVYFSETGTIVSISNTLNELTTETIGAFLNRILKMTAHSDYNGFVLQVDETNGSLYLEDTKHDGLEINININMEGIDFSSEYGRVFLNHDFPKNSFELDEFINKFHNVYLYIATETHNIVTANTSLLKHQGEYRVVGSLN